MNIVITGASRGIGKAIAEKFASKENVLLLGGRNKETLDKTANEISQAHPGCKVLVMAADIAQKAGAVAFGEWCLSHGNIDILVNNAGGFVPGNILDEPEDALEKMIAGNLYAAYHLTRTIAPEMAKNKRGHIFNICSVAGLQAYEGGGAYSISKFALNGFNQNLRHELKPHGVKVTGIFPGAVLTDSWGDFDNSSHRIMLPADIAAIVFAAAQLSPAAVAEDIILRPQLGDL